jgi:tyrosyl-tRNA synthetase
VTTLVHGEKETAKAIAASQAIFGQGSLEELDAATLAAVFAEVPSASITADSSGLPPVIDLLAACGIVPSKSAARRAISEGGAYINNQRITTDDAAPREQDLLQGRYIILRRGKRTVGAIEVVRQP